MLLLCSHSASLTPRVQVAKPNNAMLERHTGHVSHAYLENPHYIDEVGRGSVPWRLTGSFRLVPARDPTRLFPTTFLHVSQDCNESYRFVTQSITLEYPSIPTYLKLID
jgi:hypothetical protein